MKAMRILLLPSILLAAATTANAAQKPDLLLVTVDTLRADHVTSYGFEHPITPNIDGLAERGILFEDAMTTIGKTCPAFASLFTSLFPPTHGARRNGVQIRDDVPLLAELLQEAGYETAGFVSNWTLRERICGLARGFDLYDETFDRTRYALKGAERTAPSITRDALAWLAEARGQSGSHRKPIFLWVHYSEPHTPYDHHPGFSIDPPMGDERSAGWQKRWKYASEVRFTDHWIGKLLEGVEPHLPSSSTYTIFLSDHGESLGEHDYWGHGKNTYWPNLRIPLILLGPDLPKGIKVASPTSIVDLLPTMLELIGGKPPSDIEGTSLVGVWDRPLGKERQRYALGDRHTVLGKKGRNLYEDPLMIALQTQKTKTIYDFSERKLLYFDLLEDPLELEPLTEPPVETDPPLRRRLANWYRQLPKYEAKIEGELDPEDIEQLKSLGYIGSD